MTILNTVKGTVCTAVDTITAVAHTVIEKNRTSAKLNRLRLVMKNESELMNRAYIALGKQYYEMQKKGEIVPNENQKKLSEVIDKSKIKIAKARACYRKIVDSQNDIFYGTPDNDSVDYSSTDVVDITVACSNENEYESSPFEAVEDAVKEAIDGVAEVEAEAEPTTDISSKFDDADEAFAEDEESPNGELF